MIFYNCTYRQERKKKERRKPLKEMNEVEKARYEEIPEVML
jgi:hypothetical protein